MDKRFEKIGAVWASDSKDFASWVKTFSDEFFSLRLNGEERAVADSLQIPFAQLVALLELATLPSEDLEKVGRFSPDPVFWFLLVEAAALGCLDEVAAGFDEVRGASPSMAGINEIVGRSRPKENSERILSLSESDFWLLAKKGKATGVTTSSQNSVLANCAKWVKSGKEPSYKMVRFASSAIQVLADNGVLADTKNDEDRDQILEIIAKLGR